MEPTNARGDAETSGKWMQQALDALPVAGYAVDREYRYLMFNGAYETGMRESYGATIELGASVLDYLTAADERAAAKEAMDRVLAGETVTSSGWYGEEARVRRYMSLVRSPIRDERGVVGIAIVAFDETERVRAEHDLRESEARFRATFEQATVGMAQVAMDGRWMQVNDRLCEILGYSREQLLALTFADITAPDTIEADMEALRRLQAGEAQSYHVEKRYIRVDRSLVWVDLTVSIVRDEHGRPEYMVDIVEDIDQRKRAEHALRESEERYRALVEAVRDIVFVIGGDDRIRYVNDAAAQWLHSTSAELVGRRRVDVFPAGSEWSDHQGESLRTVLETGEPLYVEYPARFPGGVRWQATSLAPLRDSEGNIDGVLGIGRDITERKVAEERRVGELEHLAHADALTGLLNRRGFDLLSRQSVEQAARAEQGVGVIFADLDGLKELNDECGHAAGDQALRDAATVMRVTLRSADVIARVGGDEFVVLAVGEDEASIALLVERLQDGIQVFNASHDRSRPLSMSCGVACRAPGTAVKLGRLIADADAAMYREKSLRAGSSAPGRFDR